MGNEFAKVKYCNQAFALLLCCSVNCDLKQGRRSYIFWRRYKKEKWLNTDLSGALVHKIQYQKKDTPPALYDLVQPASAVHNYNTRYATNQNLCRPFSRTNYGLARFSVVASQTWEATPMKIKCLPSNSFKKEYKLFLLDSQASWTTLICYLVLFI